MVGADAPDPAGAVDGGPFAVRVSGPGSVGARGPGSVGASGPGSAGATGLRGLVGAAIVLLVGCITGVIGRAGVMVGPCSTAQPGEFFIGDDPGVQGGAFLQPVGLICVLGANRIQGPVQGGQMVGGIDDLRGAGVVVAQG